MAPWRVVFILVTALLKRATTGQLTFLSSARSRRVRTGGQRHQAGRAIARLDGVTA